MRRCGALGAYGVGDRDEDGSMELLVVRHSKEDPRRIPLFDGNTEPNPHIRPIGKE